MIAPYEIGSFREGCYPNIIQNPFQKFIIIYPEKMTPNDLNRPFKLLKY